MLLHKLKFSNHSTQTDSRQAVGGKLPHGDGYLLNLNKCQVKQVKKRKDGNYNVMDGYVTMIIV